MYPLFLVKGGDQRHLIEACHGSCGTIKIHPCSKHYHRAFACILQPFASNDDTSIRMIDSRVDRSVIYNHIVFFYNQSAVSHGISHIGVFWDDDSMVIRSLRFPSLKMDDSR
jgi:hypothetical protein